MTQGNRSLVVALVGWGIAIVSAIAVVVLRIVRDDPPVPNTFGMGPTSMLAFVGFGLTWSTVGALLVSRRPGNATGYVVLLGGVAYVVSILACAIVFAALADGSPTAMTVAQWAGWLTGLATVIGGFTFVLAVVFPTGRGHTPAWQALARLTAVMTLVASALLMTQPGPLHLFNTLENPIGFGPDLRPIAGAQLSTIVVLGAIGVIPMVMWAFVSRYRAASTIERLQLRWFAAATTAWVVGLVFVSIAGVFFRGQLGELPLTVFAVTGITVPLAIGIAILRYRLYDIDRLISRTLGYLIVSVILAGVFIVATWG